MFTKSSNKLTDNCNNFVPNEMCQGFRISKKSNFKLSCLTIQWKGNAKDNSRTCLCNGQEVYFSFSLTDWSSTEKKQKKAKRLLGTNFHCLQPVPKLLLTTLQVASELQDQSINQSNTSKADFLLLFHLSIIVYRHHYLSCIFSCGFLCGLHHSMYLKIKTIYI